MIALLERKQVGDQGFGLGRGHNFVTGGRRIRLGQYKSVRRGLSVDFARDEKETIRRHAAVRVQRVGIVEIPVQPGGIGEALGDVAQVRAVTAVAEKHLALPDVIARIGAAGDFLAIVILGRAPAADDVGAGGGGPDLLGVTVDASVGGVDMLTLMGRAGGIPWRDVGASLLLDGSQMAEFKPGENDQAEPGEKEGGEKKRKEGAKIRNDVHAATSPEALPGASPSYGSSRISAARRLPRTRSRNQSISIQPRCKAKMPLPMAIRLMHMVAAIWKEIETSVAVTIVTWVSGFSRMFPCMTPPKPSMARTSRMP